MPKFVVMDTETTGLNRIHEDSLYVPAQLSKRGCEVIQIGGIVVNDGVVEKMFCHFCDIIQADVPTEVFKVHGISAQDVRKNLSCVYLPEVIQNYIPELLEPNMIFVGFNFAFDKDAIRQSICSSGLDFNPKLTFALVPPTEGQYYYDLAEYTKGKDGGYRKLSYLSSKIKDKCCDFISKHDSVLECNDIDLYHSIAKTNHSSLFDSIATYMVAKRGYLNWI